MEDPVITCRYPWPNVKRFSLRWPGPYRRARNQILN